MIKASIATVLFSLALLAYAQFGGVGVPWFVPVSGLAIAGIAWLSTQISAFLRIFIGLYVLAFWFLAAVTTLQSAGLLSDDLQSFVPPAFMTMAVAGFAIIVFGISRLRVIRRITDLADPYFNSTAPSSPANGPLSWIAKTEGRVGMLVLGISIAINFVQVGLQIRLNLWYRDLFNALQEYKVDEFWFQLLGIFVPLALVWVIVGLFDLYFDRVLKIRWRASMTDLFTRRWMEDGRHYRIPLLATGTDNPDQRIQSDVNDYIVQVYNLSVTLLSQAATLVSFIVLLWGVSRDFVLPFTTVQIPGLLVWLVVVYAVVGTWLTHVIGRPLIGLLFERERVEADFRFSLARLREYGEQVALMRGEQAERTNLHLSFSAVIGNYLRVLTRNMKLTTFTLSYGQTSVVFPYILAAPSFFLKKITLGQFQQTAQAFRSVEGALSFFVSSYTTIAAFQAIVDRLSGFSSSIDAAAAAKRDSAIAMPSGAGNDVVVQNLNLKLPTGVSIVAIPSLTLREGESVLLTGPSGSGKSTLFRAIAGIWPFGSGAITVPGARSVLLLPQAPYLPQGVLRDAVSYPASPGHYPDEAVRAALAAVGLSALQDRLDEAGLWAQTLSGGEKQRLALARALLAKPDWLFLDEATSALDEPSEADAYAALARALPNTTVVSIGHRSTLVPVHDRQLTMRKGDGGLFRPEDVQAQAIA